MDPLSIATSVVGLTATCLTTCKKLSDLAGNYEDVPVVIAMICSESTLISIALSELQMKILRRDDLSQAWASRTDVLMAFETALTGCMVVFSCLEAETRQLQSQNSSSMGVWAKIRFMWNQDRLKELLNALRGQQTSIGFLLKILETDTLSDIQRSLRDNRSRIQAGASQAQSLRSRNPSIRIGCESIFDNDTAKLSLFDIEAVSAVAPSELDFEFDDLVLNSQAYRRAFARAQADSEQPQIHVVEGDLIDFSEAQSSIDNSDAATIRELNRDLQGLSMVPDPQSQALGTESTLQQPRPRRNSWDAQEDSFSRREIERPKHPGVLSSQKPSQEKPRVRYCDKCSGPITGQFVRALDGVWHLDCFKCADCNQSITARFFPHDDNGTEKPLCERDYFRRLDLLCFKCDQALRGNYITALDRKYHIEHFSCETCNVVFKANGSYYEHGNKVFCMVDYVKLYAQRCEACKFPILKQFVEARRSEDSKLLMWHPECYVIMKELSIVLPPSSRHREYLTLLDNGGEREGRDRFVSKVSDIQEQHEAFLANLHVATLNFLDVFRETTTTALASKENQSVAFEIWTILIGLTNLLFQVVAEVTDEMPNDKQLKTFGTAFNKYAEAFIPGASFSSDSLCEALTVSVRSVLRAGLVSVLASEDSRKLNKFMSKLSATAPPQLPLPYQAQPPKGSNQGILCEGCGYFVKKEAYTEVSTPGLRWHVGCFACVACKSPGAITPIPSQTMAGHFECQSPGCGWGGIVIFVPSYAQTVHLMWRAWGVVVLRGLKGPIQKQDIIV
ncbi:hypothetical protein NW755_012893 [Fusarium falciforme]|uniref:LIM zinc-binding domain-containing protein n=1 Tax=Fusarium falciforme TaxID=195108 RepID=A0A9W8QV28_9HYPO|nr:hypothetical protein NW755_012893 [Fusarium falciforme]